MVISLSNMDELIDFQDFQDFHSNFCTGKVVEGKDHLKAPSSGHLSSASLSDLKFFRTNSTNTRTLA